MSQTSTEILQEAAKASPPVTVLGLHFAGVSLNDWVLMGTLVYIALQAYVLVRDKIWPGKKRDGGEG